MDLSMIEWVAVAVGVGVLAAVALIWFGTGSRLMRCPETSSVALVDIEPRPSAGAERIGVGRCDLRPEGQGCGEGCLDRLSETAPGYRVRLAALRPFERP